MDYNENNYNSLQVEAFKAIFKRLIYMAPEIIKAYLDMLGRPPVEWPLEVCDWLRVENANYWNNILTPLPPDNQ